MSVHTIFGAGGAVADQLLPVLLKHLEKVRLVSRHTKQIPGVESIAADATDYQQTLKAIQGSAVVYLLIGLPYDIRIWKPTWPTIMNNMIKACAATGARLIFFDNVYMYGKVDGWMTEETPYRPLSKKGEVRAAIATQLLNETKAGNLQALIARSADFYGPAGFKTSIPNLLVIGNLMKGKKPQWLGDADQPHSFTYIPDAAQALYLLAKKEDAFGQTWHLPTAGDPLTGRAFIEHATTAMNKPVRFSAIPKWMLSMAGLFDRTMKELGEMYYQNDSPYLFDSTKFNNAFRFTPTSYTAGIKETVQWGLAK
jgi:nucleoside-diphosphate-sugar epimerase